MNLVVDLFLANIRNLSHVPPAASDFDFIADPPEPEQDRRTVYDKFVEKGGARKVCTIRYLGHPSATHTNTVANRIGIDWQ